MSQYDYPKVIAVLGATGRQGSGVVQSLLRKIQPAFSVLALTRDLDSASAQPLRLEAQNNERLQLGTANVFDLDTLHRAFKGVHGVFAVTNHRAPGQQVTQEEDLQDELIAGRNIIKAAKIFARGPEITASKTYPVVGPKISFSELATVFEATTSRPARFKPSTLHEWGATVSASAGAGFERDIRQMIEWITVAPDDKICYGTMNPDEDQSQSDLGVRASTFQEWLERSGWTGPDDGVK
ncbi:hypothetical protein APSETT444_010451 [Aspergillus pseudonomiae]